MQNIQEGLYKIKYKKRQQNSQQQTGWKPMLTHIGSTPVEDHPNIPPRVPPKCLNVILQIHTKYK